MNAEAGWNQIDQCQLRRIGAEDETYIPTESLPERLPSTRESNVDGGVASLTAPSMPIAW